MIQFSNQQYKAQSERRSNSPSNNSTVKLLPPCNNNNNLGKSALSKRSEGNSGESLEDNKPPNAGKSANDEKCNDTKGGEDGITDLENANDMEDDDEEETASARTADEQMDYLESLEPCPCYAKCCLDSIITLFCVTLLG